MFFTNCNLEGTVENLILYAKVTGFLFLWTTISKRKYSLNTLSLDLVGLIISCSFTGSIIMYGALLLFESEFVHIVAISFTSLILTELLMVALTVQTWHWLMIVAELLSLACYIASLVFLHEFIGGYIDLHEHTQGKITNTL